MQRLDGWNRRFIGGLGEITWRGELDAFRDLWFDSCKESIRERSVVQAAMADYSSFANSQMFMAVKLHFDADN